MKSISICQNVKADTLLHGKANDRSQWYQEKWSISPTDWKILEEENCFIGEYAPDPFPVSFSFGDLTGWECFCNKVHLSDWLPEGTEPYDCFLAGLDFLRLLTARLVLIPNRSFFVFCSFDGDHAVVNFHQKREGEPYLESNLEGYLDEAIVVVEVGDMPIWTAGSNDITDYA